MSSLAVLYKKSSILMSTETVHTLGKKKKGTFLVGNEF